MKIAFITKYDIKSRRPWSGTIHYMAEALERYCGEVRSLGPTRLESERLVKKAAELTLCLTKKGYDYSHSICLSKIYQEFKPKFPP